MTTSIDHANLRLGPQKKLTGRSHYYDIFDLNDKKVGWIGYHGRTNGWTSYLYVEGQDDAEEAYLLLNEPAPEGKSAAIGQVVRAYEMGPQKKAALARERAFKREELVLVSAKGHLNDLLGFVRTKKDIVTPQVLEMFPLLYEDLGTAADRLEQAIKAHLAEKEKP